ncbi:MULTISPECIES: H-NS family nucleoid-associated regulatory protein [Ramlibacter]|uniref:H-NS histone family protein n=1 Tax=Ramlibacter pinisoli TaxID=2682844 RepID=A0A6N8IUV6_9BURK|nr:MULTISPECIES: H-NS histone family protein [Ramlibacter]MBA2964821.1 H-NS histone family protein [Ramlibacter sp. CGMCC 1.13660]MVQ29786.1 H-NS histone family protein [Ramlibacter pinisoli]
MATYLELKEQAEKLLQQAENMRAQETEQAIADIKAKMQAYGLTAADLGFGGGTRGPRAKKAAKTPAPVKYRGPNGETWGGGRGRKPQWVVEALAKGKKIEDFAV